MYELQFTSQSARYFKKLKNKHLKEAYESALLNIKSDPYAGSPKLGDLSGIYGYDVKHHGVNYEIAYTINEVGSKKVIVLLAGTRENFYEQLKRYLK